MAQPKAERHCTWLEPSGQSLGIDPGGGRLPTGHGDRPQRSLCTEAGGLPPPPARPHLFPGAAGPPALRSHPRTKFPLAEIFSSMFFGAREGMCWNHTASNAVEWEHLGPRQQHDSFIFRKRVFFYSHFSDMITSACTTFPRGVPVGGRSSRFYTPVMANKAQRREEGFYTPCPWRAGEIIQVFQVLGKSAFW